MINELSKMMSILQFTIINSLSYLSLMIACLFLILFLNKLTHYRLSFLGIIPRHWLGIPGIICAPFIHAHFNHLFFNLFPLIILSVLILPFGFGFYWNLTWILIVYSGILIWLFARRGIHIGASALITAYWGFLLTQAFFNQADTYYWFTSFICIYYLASIFFGIFPSKADVSWEGHFLGLIAGSSLALLAHHYPLIHHYLFDNPFLVSFPKSLNSLSG
jgi:membrane associated rhomboid family serine protease